MQTTRSLVIFPGSLGKDPGACVCWQYSSIACISNYISFIYLFNYSDFISYFIHSLYVELVDHWHLIFLPEPEIWVSLLYYADDEDYKFCSVGIWCAMGSSSEIFDLPFSTNSQQFHPPTITDHFMIWTGHLIWIWNSDLQTKSNGADQSARSSGGILI